MKDDHRSLSEKREALIAKSTIQRELLAAQISELWRPGTIATGKTIFSLAGKKPVISMGLAAMSLLFFRNRRLFSLIATGAVGLQAWTRFSPAILYCCKKVSSFRSRKNSG